MSTIKPEDLHRLDNTVKVLPRFNAAYELLTSRQRMIDDLVTELIRKGFLVVEQSEKDDEGIYTLRAHIVVYKKSEKEQQKEDV